MFKWKKAMILLLALVCLTACAAAEAQVSALFINVGKADAAILFLDDYRVLVDSGTKGAHDQLMRVLDAYKIRHFDAVIVTHTDKDHAGGLNKMYKAGITTDMMYAGHLHSEKSLDDHRVYEASVKYDVPLSWLKAGDQLTFGSCTLHVLGPLSQDSVNENNNSLVIRLVTPEGDMLLTGDMEAEEEAELMQAGAFSPVPVLKVSHHGEDDTTSRSFVLLTRPQWAVISTSTAEEPDTPDDKIISRLMEVGSGIAQTQSAEVGILITLDDGKAQAQQINWQ